MLRTHTCGELTSGDVGKPVRIAGWVQVRRDHGGVIFIDLRDRYGITQLVCDPSHNKKVHSTAEHVGREFVLLGEGKVRSRPKDMFNSNMKTGEIEVIADGLQILTRAEVPPIEIEDDVQAGEETRLKYRYLDLRRPVMQGYLIARHKAAQATREYLNGRDFLEIETPLLIRSTPEGARDYVVPSRTNPGKFYALPQSPQLYKQILMIAGFDRYYQIARCLRDEDLRQDRQPEHTQIDIEMSFAEQDDVMELVEGCCRHVFNVVTGKKASKPFKRIAYAEAMEKYGSDKPDLRFGMELIDVTDVARSSSFKIFTSAEQVKCIAAEKDFSRKEIDELIEWAKQNGAKGLAWMKVSARGLESSIAKFFDEGVQKSLLEKTKAKKGSVLFFVADRPKTVAEVLGKLRVELAGRLDLIRPDQFEFCWVTDFPLFDWDEDEKKWTASHHPFTMPRSEDVEFLEKDPGRVQAQLYDLVLNGIELGSGSIRINDPGLQERVLKVIGIGSKEAKDKFGFLLEAYRYGAPVHGGIGWGFDRTVALMLGFNDIREVIAFPKNKKAECPMDGSPSGVDERQLRELHVKSDANAKG